MVDARKERQTVKFISYSVLGRHAPNQARSMVAAAPSLPSKDKMQAWEASKLNFNDFMRTLEEATSGSTTIADTEGTIGTSTEKITSATGYDGDNTNT